MLSERPELLITETPAPVADEDAAEEAEAALSNVDAEFGRTTDPVRMYMREMGTKDLLTREGEIEIAKRIEEGTNQAARELVRFAAAMEHFIKGFDRIDTGEDVARGFDLILLGCGKIGRALAELVRVRRAHILDGRIPHALLLEFFTREGVGTMVTP